VRRPSLVLALCLVVLAGCTRWERARRRSATDSVRFVIPGITTAAGDSSCDTTGVGGRDEVRVRAMVDFNGSARHLLLTPARRREETARRFVRIEPRSDSADVRHFWDSGDESSQGILGSVGPYVFVVSSFSHHAGAQASTTRDFAVIELGRGPVELLPPAKRDSVLLRPSYAGGHLGVRFQLLGDTAAAEVPAEVPSALRPYVYLPGPVRAHWSGPSRPVDTHGWSRVDALPNLRWQLLQEFFQLESVRGEQLGVGEEDFLVWTRTPEGGYRTSLIRGAGDRVRELGGSDGLWIAAGGRIWRMSTARFPVPGKVVCGAAASNGNP